MNHNHQNKHSHGKHMLLMIAGCLAPILVLVLMKSLGFGGGTLFKVISSFGFLLCPLIHIFMMKGMAGDKKENCHEEKTNDNVKK